MSSPGSPESARPLADYFWIAGLDGQQLVDAFAPASWPSDGPDTNGLVETAITEEPSPETDDSSIMQSPRASVHHSRHDSYQRLSQLSDEARDAIRGLDEPASPRSTRSSITIKPAGAAAAAAAAVSSSAGYRVSTAFTDADFDKAMKKFATDRDAFFLDLSFHSADAAHPTPAKVRVKTQKIVVADEPSPLPNRNFGSIRRHLSFKDMSSTRRQPSMARRTSTRTSRRISSYNSVVPSPESFKSAPDHHPLARKFEPVLLERFPRQPSRDRAQKRPPFPDYVPMFAFPHDIKIVAADAKPKSTWHQFSMTAADNSRLTAVAVTVWIPLNRQTAIDLERRCEAWRNAHMSDAERELAMSLAERLTIESAKLSALLSQLPAAPQGSRAREALEDEISAVEEKIGMMSDMLRPLRHGSVPDIQGLAASENRFWIPRAYGVMGGDSALAGFWRQWLRAVVAPMAGGEVLRVAASSPKVGMWQPLERYVATLCLEAPRPMSSKTQVQLSIRELHLYAKKEAANELPGSRTTDLYPLFRTLSISNIVLLFEYVLSEARIVLLSSHTAMLHAVSQAILELIWPLEWTGIYIPVLPFRLVQALDAPCPYICGISRAYGTVALPDDDYVLVDLDKNEVHSTAPPPFLPKQQRKKLMSLLHQAAPLHPNAGLVPGPPAYAVETFPYNAFAAELDSVFTAIAKSTNLDKLASLSSTAFGAQAASDAIRRAPILNAFLAAGPTRGKSLERPRTSSTARQSSQNGSDGHSPVVGTIRTPTSAVSRTDSGYALQTSLREKRSGHFDSLSKRSISGPTQILRKSSLPFAKHNPTPSGASMVEMRNGSVYAPSTYAQSTLAASTIMPGLQGLPAKVTEGTSRVEGHQLQWRTDDGTSTCVVCDEKAQGGYFRCSGCGFVIHDRCTHQVPIVCSATFFPDQIRAAFARCMASLFYTYRRFMYPAPPTTKTKAGTNLAFNSDAFLRSLPPDHAAYMEMLQQTQAWNEFIMDREENASSPSIALFDAVIAAKRARAGFRSSLQGITLNRKSFVSRSPSWTPRADLLSDTSQHQWRVIATGPTSDRLDLDAAAARGRDYHTIVTRAPAKLEEGLFKQEEKVPHVPSVLPKKPRHTTLSARMNGLGMNAP